MADHGPLGTLCARLGCMPSKVLLQSTLALSHARRLGALGVVLAVPPALDWPLLRARKSELVADFVGQIVHAMETSKSFTLLRGGAEFIDDRSLRVAGRRIVGQRWVLATGSSPVRPPIPGLDEVSTLTFTSDDDPTLAEMIPWLAQKGVTELDDRSGQDRSAPLDSGGSSRTRAPHPFLGLLVSGRRWRTSFAECATKYPEEDLSIVRACLHQEIRGSHACCQVRQVAPS